MHNHELKYKELTRAIIGCAMQVHSYFGVGFPEIVYKRALLMELRNLGLECKEEFEKDIVYKGKVISRRRLDILVEGLILLECKAQKELDNGDMVQTLNYLRVFELEVGLLLNFGAPSLFFKRYVNTIRV